MRVYSVGELMRMAESEPEMILRRIGHLITVPGALCGIGTKLQVRLSGN